MSSAVYVPLVSEQPKAASMALGGQHATEKSAHCCQNRQICADDNIEHRCHRRSRFRRFIFPTALAFLLLIAGLFAFSCLKSGHFSDWGLDELIPRSFSSSDSTSNNGSFVNHKFYLIVLFVGLIVVIGLGIALSFWCCRGSFENPLCCPCYLCACCGGIACLECIACGICAEAVEQA